MTVPAGQAGVLNALCPYFTMFPIEFPLGVLKRHAGLGYRVLDPFCGRGTTAFAARLLGLESVSVDSNPVATAVAEAKLVVTTPAEIVSIARRILSSSTQPVDIPAGAFWALAYERTTLVNLCKLRESLLRKCDTPARKALRGVLLGALHGPRTKGAPSYFSNQCPRTYAPKPAYSVRYWEEHTLSPQRVDVLDLIARRAKRYYETSPPAVQAKVLLGDSRDRGTFARLRKPASLIVTSPPYYGMRTYIPDQWLRGWFLGGPAMVDYRSAHQLQHNSPSAFADELEKVWRNVQSVSDDQARLVIRFGGIRDRDHADPLTILEASLSNTRWEITSSRTAGLATSGKRQAATFLEKKNSPLEEYDVTARLIS